MSDDIKKDHKNIVENEKSEEQSQKASKLSENVEKISKSTIKPTSPTIPKPKGKSEQENAKSEYFTKSVNEAKIVWKSNIESATVIKWLEAKKANKNLTMAKFCETQGILRSMLCKWLSNFKDKDLILKAITIPISKGRSEDANNKSPSKRNKFQCELCEKFYDTKGDLKGHIQVDHDKMLQYECMFCNVRFSSKSRMQKHKTFHHKDELNKINNEDLNEKSITIAKSKGKSEQEDNKSLTKSDLKQPIQLVHDKKVKFECEFCFVWHSNKFSLQKHIAFRHNDKLKKLNKTNEKDEDLNEKSIAIPKSLTENEQLIEIPEATESESLKEKSITIPKFPFSKKNLKGQLISE